MLTIHILFRSDHTKLGLLDIELDNKVTFGARNLNFVTPKDFLIFAVIF